MNKLILSAAGACLAVIPARAAELANSISQFSETQGMDGWYTGYRNYSVDGGGDDYHPDSGFIPFTSAQWLGNGFKLGGNPPWTECFAENCHPNSGGAEHWVIRRWVAQDLDGVTPLQITFSVRKTNPNCGSGVTVALLHNGFLKYSEAIDGTDDAGITNVYFLNVLPGDKIDLALTPVGTDGDRADGCDGSAFSMSIDDELPADPHQPDGTPFVPSSGGDTDGDGIPDAWEERYAGEGNLGRFSATGDDDGDGLLDKDEYERGSDPTIQDTDGDGLSDKVETRTGIYVSPEDTGSDPTRTDTDGDGLSDFAEVNATPRTDPNKADTDDDSFSDSVELFFGSDPSQAADTPLTHALADSVTQFSGVQGQHGWEYGYRNINESGNTLNYDPVADFIPFAGGSEIDVPWEGGEESPQHWRETHWDFQDNNPWTEITATGAHPNGINGGVQHWVVRRWKATALATPTPVAVYWHISKSNPADDGVTGLVFLNGRIFDSKTIAGNDAIGVTRKAFTVLQPGDVVDLVLTPTGLSHSYDWSDGSSQWLRIDQRIPAAPVSSDGAFFAAPGAPDTDGDGLADAWELYYTANNTVDPPLPGSLTRLTSGAADEDGDGLTNAQEMARGTHPLFADTDNDGLSDAVETNTGVFAGPTATGTHPLRADSDEDGLSDFTEITAIQFKTNPYLADSDNDGSNDATEIRRAGLPVLPDPLQNVHGGLQPAGGLASSLLDFTGSQDPDSWSWGYRDLSTDAGEPNYDPDQDFILFLGGEGMGEWDGFEQQYDPAGIWRLADAAPWTRVDREHNHPNGPNSGPVHWTIRRWTATVTEPRPLGLVWHLSKANTACGDGVTGALYINGERQDEAAVAFNDALGLTRIFYAIVAPGDKIDLILQHNGNEGGDGDGCDGSNTILRIVEEFPSPAIQPDGSIFGAPATEDFVITSVTRAGDGSITLSWPSESGKVYDVYSSASLATGNWNRLSPAAGLNGTGGTLQYTDSPAATTGTLFYRVGLR